MRYHLRFKRELAKLSVKGMAELVGVKELAYGRIELGHSNGKLDTWRKIQEVLKIPNDKMWEYITEGVEEE